MISTAFVNCDAETVYSSDYGYKIVRECDEITESVMKAIHDYESHLEEYKFAIPTAAFSSSLVCQFHYSVFF